MSDTVTASRIVVGVDGSEPSKRALRWAQWLASVTGSDIVAVNAREPFGKCRRGMGAHRRRLACPVLVVHGDTAPPPR